MKDLQTILEENTIFLGPKDFDVVFDLRKYIYEAMKEYAEEYAKECLEVAAIRATIQINTGTSIHYRYSFDNKEFPFHESFINRDSITKIPLPAHE